VSPQLTTGYGVSAHGCSYLAGKSQPISGTADWPCDIAGLGALAAYPRLVDHPASGCSEIEKARQRIIDDRTRRGWKSVGNLYLRRQWRSIIKRLSVRLP